MRGNYLIEELPLKGLIVLVSLEYGRQIWSEVKSKKFHDAGFATERLNRAIWFIVPVRISETEWNAFILPASIKLPLPYGRTKPPELNE